MSEMRRGNEVQERILLTLVFMLVISTPVMCRVASEDTGKGEEERSHSNFLPVLSIPLSLPKTFNSVDRIDNNGLGISIDNGEYQWLYKFPPWNDEYNPKPPSLHLQDGVQTSVGVQHQTAFPTPSIDASSFSRFTAEDAAVSDGREVRGIPEHRFTGTEGNHATDLHSLGSFFSGRSQPFRANVDFSDEGPLRIQKGANFRQGKLNFRNLGAPSTALSPPVNDLEFHFPSGNNIINVPKFKPLPLETHSPLKDLKKRNPSLQSPFNLEPSKEASEADKVSFPSLDAVSFPLGRTGRPLQELTLAPRGLNPRFIRNVAQRHPPPKSIQDIIKRQRSSARRQREVRVRFRDSRDLNRGFRGGRINFGRPNFWVWPRR